MAGTHQLVIGDHNGAFTPNAQSAIRFHRAAAVEHADSITVRTLAPGVTSVCLPSQRQRAIRSLECRVPVWPQEVEQNKRSGNNL